MKGRGKGNYKGRKPSPKGYANKERQDGSDRDERGTRDNYRNDISWYSKYPNLLLAAGSFPYPYRPGMEFDVTGIVTPTTVGGTTLKSIPGVGYFPGVMVLDWMPSFGISNTSTDPISIAGKEFYARVRAAFSGSLDADAPDYVMYIGALDSVFSYIAWLKRMYRILSVWTPENYILPDALLQSMMLDVDDVNSLRQNKTKLWQLINELVYQSRKFTCPAVMDLMNRHYWMNDNVYADADTINSQFYVFNQIAYFKFDMLNMSDGNPGPGLKMVPAPYNNRSGHATLTPEILYNFGVQLIEALISWDEAYTISGYLKRAFEGTPNFVVDELPQNQPFTPVYEPEVLAQIENSRTLPGAQYVSTATLTGLNVTQDVVQNCVISNPQYPVTSDQLDNIAGHTYMINPLLNIRSASPTVADSVIASRLQTHVRVNQKDNTMFDIYAGTEIAVLWRVIPGNRDVSGLYQEIGYVQYPCFDVWKLGTTQTAVAPLSQAMYRLIASHVVEQFDWHPFGALTYIASTQSPPATPTSAAVYFSGDTHNLTMITLEDMRNLHKVCIFSELNAFSVA